MPFDHETSISNLLLVYIFKYPLGKPPAWALLFPKVLIIVFFSAQGSWMILTCHGPIFSLPTLSFLKSAVLQNKSLLQENRYCDRAESPTFLGVFCLTSLMLNNLKM